MSYPFLADHYDLITPDGFIKSISPYDENSSIASVQIDHISQHFVGFDLDRELVFFNLKSVLAQIGLDAIAKHYELNQKGSSALIEIEFIGINSLGRTMLPLLKAGMKVGKLFAADPRRRVRDPDYITRMFGRADRWGAPLLSLGGLQGSNDLILEKVEGRTVAYISLQRGRVQYKQSIYGFLPTLGEALHAGVSLRYLLKLHQEMMPDLPRTLEGSDDLLLVKTQPLHIRSVFAHVAEELLVPGYHHTRASVLDPTTKATGDIYELYGKSKKEISDIPLEFYTLEPYREHVFFSDRDQLQTSLEEPDTLFKAFETAPKPMERQAAVFIVKGTQLHALSANDWITRETHQHDFPGLTHGARQALMIERYIQQQSSYPFLKAIIDNIITSEGVLLSRYFPSPLMKRLLLGDEVQHLLKRIYFQYPSSSHGNFFSSEDRGVLHDLEKFAIPVYWLDMTTNSILRYTQKPGFDSGLFVPLNHVDRFLRSTVFGIYGSNLLALSDFEVELRKLFEGVLNLRNEVDHPLLHPHLPLSMVTGGGPGAMEVGNRVAKELGILSCANIVDFRVGEKSVVNEQQQNAYVEAKMTYRLDKLVERQAEFNLDFPIFLTGGIGTDFEFALELVRRKVGVSPPHPVLLFGPKEYWREKITYAFLSNQKHRTIVGSEWLSNCFYCIQTAEQGLKIYRDFFKGILKIGPENPPYEDGFLAL